jgi:organic hydroperoxide reductase OsmC/OhrA
MSSYLASVFWRRDGAVFTDNQYSRAHLWEFDGGALVRASASPQVVRPPQSDPAGVDPEEAFVAALSSCHMLFFLSFAARDGWIVDSYVDSAVGVMARNEAGRTVMTRVTLRPDIQWSGERRPGADEIAALHHEAHESCYLANSVRTVVTVEGLPLL